MPQDRKLATEVSERGKQILRGLASPKVGGGRVKGDVREHAHERLQLGSAQIGQPQRDHVHGRPLRAALDHVRARRDH
eukprot:11442963-Alexandrium_andersonii.AAC.1